MSRRSSDGDVRVLSSVSADGLRAITGDFDTVQVWDVVTLRELGRVEHGTRYVQDTAISGDGTVFAGMNLLYVAVGRLA